MKTSKEDCRQMQINGRSYILQHLYSNKLITLQQTSRAPLADQTVSILYSVAILTGVRPETKSNASPNFIFTLKPFFLNGWSHSLIASPVGPACPLADMAGCIDAVTSEA